MAAAGGGPSAGGGSGSRAEDSGGRGEGGGNGGGNGGDEETARMKEKEMEKPPFIYAAKARSTAELEDVLPGAVRWVREEKGCAVVDAWLDCKG